MDRRTFLLRSATFLAGSLLGFSRPGQALASAALRGGPLFSPRVALIIDDIGYSLRRARCFMELEAPVTFSILPRLRYSRRLAQEIHSRGSEIMLHQPMEPHGRHQHPGPGALYVGDDTERICRTMEENIGRVPQAVGVNNHMGSRFTECGKAIRETLEVVAQKGLFFIDSLTSSRSMAYETAKGLEMVAARRHVFLDHVRDQKTIMSRLQKLELRARRRGHAIGIGHPYPETARALGAFFEEKRDPGVSWVRVSEILEASPRTGDGSPDRTSSHRLTG